MGSAGLIRDRYEPLEVVGRGGQGHVLRARDHHHDRTVALKVRDAADDGARADLLTEARVLLDLTPHHAITIVRDDLFVGDRHCLVMDWVDGRSLRRVLAEDGRPGLTLAAVTSWLAGVGEALDHLHAQRPPVIHGDVKPDNVILTPDGRSVLVDFGLAGVDVRPSAGTPGFRAPELSSDAHRTAATDIYALAATAYALLTAEAPQPGAAPDWSSVPEQYRDRTVRALARGLSIDPTARPQSAAAFVASLAPPSTPHNLPVATSRFVGRDIELAHAAAVLDEARLVTLTGIGGIGKTRLALELAHGRLASHPDGVGFADLASVADPAHVERAVAHAFGVREVPGRAIADALEEALRAGRRLLVLDNCEHLVARCAELVDALLRGCAGLLVLATSRVPLRVDGEHVVPVPPLSAGAPERLFRERAGAAGAAGPFADDAVAEICVRLEGIPLAIELAAVQCRTLTVGQISAALDDRLALLVGGSRPVARHETLRAALDWSHALLDDQQRSVLRRLAVFSGGFGTEAAEAVCGVDGAAAAVRQLADASLVVADGGRFRLLETMREYASAELERAGETAELERAHAAWFAGLARDAAREWRGRSQTTWLAMLSAEHGNLSAALHWLTRHDADGALAMSGELVAFWESHSHFSEGREWLALALARADPSDGAARARALAGAGWLACRQGDHAGAAGPLGEALAMARRLGDVRRDAEVVGMLGALAFMRSDYDEARSRFEESLARYRELAMPEGIAGALANLGALEGSLGHLSKSRSLSREATALWEGVGDLSNAAKSRMNLGVLARAGGDDTTARREFERSLAVARDLGDRGTVTFCLMNLGELDRLGGNASLATLRLHEALGIAREIGDRRAQATLLGGLGDAARADGRLRASRDLLESSLEMRAQIGDERGRGSVIASLGLTALREGAVTRSRTLCEEALEIAQRFGDPGAGMLARVGLAVVAARTGDHARAAALLREADQIPERLAPQDAALREEAAGVGVAD